MLQIINDEMSISNQCTAGYWLRFLTLRIAHCQSLAANDHQASWFGDYNDYSDYHMTGYTYNERNRIS